MKELLTHYKLDTPAGNSYSFLGLNMRDPVLSDPKSAPSPNLRTRETLSAQYANL